MAYWPEIVRDKPFASLLPVATALIVAWFAAALWGPPVWVAVGVLALTCIVLFPRILGRRAARARAASDTFSFGDVVDRMRAKDRAAAQQRILSTGHELVSDGR